MRILRNIVLRFFFSVEEKLLGTGGAIKNALKYTETDNVLVLNGDSYVDIDFYELLKKHSQTNAEMTIVLKKRKPG